MDTALLNVRLTVDYPGKPGVLRNIALTVEPGEIVGLVGQSGSGKSTLGLSILRLLGSRRARLQGHIRFGGRDLLALPEAEMRAVRGREIALVLQNPVASLNPAMRIGSQLAEAWKAHRRGTSKEMERDVAEALSAASLPPDRDLLGRYPRTLSTGMAQRVLIAMAVLHRPHLLIADEPTSALDPITQAGILQLFGKLNRERGMAMLYISHDLMSVGSLCHRLAILYEGEIVEQGPTAELFQNPQHPYTKRLLAALPALPFERQSPVAVDQDALLDAPAAVPVGDARASASRPKGLAESLLALARGAFLKGDQGALGAQHAPRPESAPDADHQVVRRGDEGSK